jgi:tetratricopeptide (TPR) repeat protein
MTKKNDETLIDIDETLSSWEVHFKENKNLYSYLSSGLLGVVVLYLAYTQLYVAPKEKEAASQMFYAEQYFEKDSLDKAMFGDGVNLGFYDIIDAYGVSTSANLANYYMGIGYLKKGEYQYAIDYLTKFKSKDNILAPIALGSTADAYSELENYDKALSYYLKAANKSNNSFTTPIYLMRAAAIHELNANFKDALKIYEQVRNDFPNTNEGRNIEKYIARVNALAAVK